MTDVSDVPTIYTGDWIDAAWINQYIGDNFRALMQGFGATGNIPYAIDADTIGALVKPSTEGLMNMGSDGLPEWLTTTNVHNFLQWNGSAFVFAPLVYRRQGGDASNWASPGTTSYTPSGKVVRQKGVASASIANAGDIQVTYPVAFSQKPIITISINAPLGDFAHRMHDDSLNGFYLHVRDVITSGTQTVEIHWEAEGIIA